MLDQTFEKEKTKRCLPSAVLVGIIDLFFDNDDDDDDDDNMMMTMMIQLPLLMVPSP